MLESLKRNEALEYQKLTPEEMESKGILGRLVGPCADFINPTRNGRQYTEELWDRVFEDSIVNEKIENKCLFGELGHPEDRTEVDMEKIAIALNERPKKDKDGKLIACFDILDTPNGRILKTLCDYGTTIGISSRGTGDVIEGENGEEVDPDTYDFECFDAVLVPAVKEARLEYFKESLDKKSNSNMLNLRKALTESLKNETEENKKVVEETLSELGIDLNEKECTNESCADKIESDAEKKTQDETEEANNDGSDELINSLKESIKENAELKVEVKSLQEKLAVSDAKVSDLEAEVSRGKSTIVRLTTIVKESRAKSDRISVLEEELKEKNKTIEDLKKDSTRVVESNTRDESRHLRESISRKNAEIAQLKEELKKLQESNAEVQQLKEELEKVKSDSANKTEELSVRVNKANKVAEGWKKKTYAVYESYINARAKMLDVKSEQIINRLPETYDLVDIDKICEELMSYEVNMNRLPFRVGKESVVRITESKNRSIASPFNDDDYVDEKSFAVARLDK